MLRNPASAQPDLPPQHRRGSSYQSLEQNHGYQSPRQHERNSSITSNSNTLALSPSATPPRRENAFNAPRPSLLPYQEYHSGFADDDLPSSPLSSSYSHRRQTSFSALLPLAIRNRTPSPTRKTSVAPVAEEMPFTGDGRRPSRPGTAVSESSQRGGFAGWLSGTAAGNALDSLSRPDSSRSSDVNVTPTKLRKTQTAMSENPATTPTDSVSAKASRFMSALSTRLAAPAQPPPVADDELYNLNVESALFPPGSPTDRDAFSPAAFKNLQANAVGLLGKFQAAYRAKVLAVRDLDGERAAQRDELEEAVTRAAHLKLQLEGMAHRAAEQEKAMQQLMDELMGEKHAREEERLARQRGAVGTAESMVSEDLGVDQDWGQRKRKSGESAWGETDEESVDESVFSRSRSPTVQGMGEGSVDLSMVKSGTGTIRARNGGGQMNALQKMFKGIAGDVEEANGCKNCQGQDSSVAWETVSMLRDENRHLRQRVGQLEVAVEGALDMVNGLGL
jgi:hypothetical protein